MELLEALIEIMHIAQWNSLEITEIDPHKCVQLISPSNEFLL